MAQRPVIGPDSRFDPAAPGPTLEALAGLIAVVAQLRGMAAQDLATATCENACVALPKLRGLLV